MDAGGLLNELFGRVPDHLDRAVDGLSAGDLAVAARTAELPAGASAADLDRVVDDRWDPPVTLGVRLLSIADDDIQHAGQAAYLRGLLGR